MATIKKRGSSYLIRVSCGYTTSGKHKEQSMTWRPAPGMTEKQIEKELQRQAVLFEENCKSTLVSGGHVKFDVFLDQYFSEYANHALRERTRDSYERMKPRVSTALGHLYLDKITPRQIQSFIQNLSEPGINQRTGGTLSRKTIKNYLVFLSSVFAHAIRMKMIKDNPCRNTTIPAAPTPRKEWYTLEEAQALLASLDGAPSKYIAFIVLAIFGGYRREELCGLDWSDIDFDRRLISISKAALYTPSKGIYIDKTKTEGSTRIATQPEIVFDSLRAWQTDQHERREALGDQWEASNRVFTAEFGGPMHPNTPYTWLKKHCDAHNLRFVGLHALRHLNAALLIRAGVDVQTVAAALGHSQVTTTLNIYAYEFADAKAAASKAVADALTGDLIPNPPAAKA